MAWGTATDTQGHTAAGTHNMALPLSHATRMLALRSYTEDRTSWIAYLGWRTEDGTKIPEGASEHRGGEQTFVSRGGPGAPSSPPFGCSSVMPDPAIRCCTTSVLTEIRPDIDSYSSSVEA